MRKTYTPSLGKRFSTVILRAKKDDFNKAVEGIKLKLKKFSETAKADLQKEIDNSREQLINTLLPGVKKNPPDEFIRLITAAKPDDETARRYLNKELDRIMPNIDTLLKEMTLTCDYKDVTYEVLNEKEFQEALRAKFPYEKFPSQPYTEFEAAKQGELPIDINSKALGV